MEEKKNKGGRPKGSKSRLDALKQKQKDLVLEALKTNLGILAPAIREIGLPRMTFNTWYQDDLEFRKKVDDVREEVIDFVESQLLKQIKDGAAAQTIFYLKTKGKSRGYIETTEQNLTIDSIRIKYIVPTEEQLKLTDNSGQQLLQDNNIIKLDMPE